MAVFGPYPAVVTSIHDGDTCRVDLDLGFGIHATAFSARLYGINAPELSIATGPASRDYLISVMPVGSHVAVISYGWDKYGGRFDAVVMLNGVNVNDLMVSSGHAVPMP